jgi:hypothetical protein
VLASKDAGEHFEHRRIVIDHENGVAPGQRFQLAVRRGRRVLVCRVTRGGVLADRATGGHLPELLQKRVG